MTLEKDNGMTKERQRGKFPGAGVALLVSLITALIMPITVFSLTGIREGDIPKEIVLEDLRGETVDVSGFVGRKPVVLVFWKLTEDTTFLDYSLDELLFLKDFHELYHDSKGLKIFGVYTPRSDKDVPREEILSVRDMIRSNRITFPILIDRGLKMFREYGVIALPSTVMIDSTGRIKFFYPSFPIAARTLFSKQIMDLIGMGDGPLKKEEAKAGVRDSEAFRLYRYALQMYRKGLREQAISPLKKSLTLDPAMSEPHNLMGILLAQQGRPQEAEKEFKKSIALAENNTAARFNYGLYLFENGRDLESEQHLRAALALDNGLAEAHYVLGLLYKESDRTSEAVNELKTALAFFDEQKPGSLYDRSVIFRILTLYALSEIHAAHGDTKEAIILLRQAARAAVGAGEAFSEERVFRGQELMIYDER